ncbi:MAG: hypothetical protein GY896_02305 [Gammaproteobacteria bacterium]|nr:hypothetical protein [Gammaproteobacteria bacterium]
MLKSAVKFLFLLAFAATTSISHAALIEYSFSGSGYTGGATADGTFRFDTDTSIFSDISIISTGGFHPARSYTLQHMSFSNALVLLDPSDGPGYANDPVFHIILQNGGLWGDLAFTTVWSDIATCHQDGCTSRDDLKVADVTSLTGIEVSAVPVPAAIWLFGTALFGLVGFGRRKAAMI